jgi:hypothetical protein
MELMLIARAYALKPRCASAYALPVPWRGVS